MIDFIENEKIFIGMTKEDAKNKLGSAEWLSWDYDNNKHNENVWNYNLGKLPGAFTKEGKQVEIFFSDNKISFDMEDGMRHDRKACSAKLSVPRQVRLGLV